MLSNRNYVSSSTFLRNRTHVVDQKRHVIVIVLDYIAKIIIVMITVFLCIFLSSRSMYVVHVQ